MGGGFLELCQELPLQGKDTSLPWKEGGEGAGGLEEAIGI